MPDEYADLIRGVVGKPRTKQPLDLISQYESSDANVPNYRFDPGHTAQGYYQITNTNWRKIGPQVGVDLKQHPSAMAAPREVQAKVAGEMFRRRGFADWAPFNPRLAAAIKRGEAGPQEPAPDDEYSKLIRETTAQPEIQSGAQGIRTRRRAQANVQASVNLPQSRVGIQAGLNLPQPKGQPRAMKGAQVGGEAQPSEATTARGAFRNVAAMSPANVTALLPTEAGDYVNQMVADTTTGLMERGAGLAKYQPTGLPGGTGLNLAAGIEPPATIALRKGARTLREASGAIDQDTQRAGVNVPLVGRVTTKDVQNVGSGAIASAPALILQRLGVPAPVAFGLDAYLASQGRGDELKASLKELGLGAATGGLYEIPLPGKMGLLKQLGAKLGLGAAGGYGLAKAFGVPEEEARKNAAVTALFMATGAKNELPEKIGENLRPEPQGVEAKLPQPSEGAKTAGMPAITEQPAAVVSEVDTSARAAEPQLRHVDLQARVKRGPNAGDFRKETRAEREARQAQVNPSQPASEISAENPPQAAQPVRPETTATIPETKTPRLAQGVEAKAVAAKLTKGFEDLPEYQTVNVADQASRATELLKSNPEQAKRIAMGQELPPEGLLPESVFTAVENRALANKDVETIRDLATASTLTKEATGMGQRIRMLAERNPASAVSAIQDIQVAREARAQKIFGKNGANKIKSEIQIELRRAAPKAKDWASFLDEIRC